MKVKVLIVFILLGVHIGHTQEQQKSPYYQLKNIDKSSIDKNIANAKKQSLSKNSYLFMSLRKSLNANNILMCKTKSDDIVDFQKELIDNLIETAETSKSIQQNKSKYRDSYKGWIVTAPNEANKNTIHKEIPLFESYSFFYVAQFLYYYKNLGWLEENDKNREWWLSTVDFIEKNVWTKWYERSKKEKGNGYAYFLRSRTHMGSHWAGIALYLNKITSNQKIKDQTDCLLSQYNTLLTRNLKEINHSYCWNSTYDDVTDTYAIASEKEIIQDVSHGNHVVSYIIAAYEAGEKEWSIEDINKLANTFKYVIYSSDKKKCYDNVNGKNKGRLDRAGWGNNLGDGWVKLIDYDSEVKIILKDFSKTKTYQQYNQQLAFEVLFLTVN